MNTKEDADSEIQNEKNSSESEQDKGIEKEKEGEREKEKAGTRSGTYKHREEKNTREQAREIVGEKRDGCSSGQRDGKGKNSDGLQDRDEG